MITTINLATMFPLHRISLLIAFFFCLNCLKAQFQIGYYTTTFTDASRGNRAIETAIYYPAIAAGNNSTVAAGQFPYIVFGHGFSMTWEAYQNIWETLVPQGYILVFPKTESGLFGVDHQAFGWDLQFLVHQIQTEANNTNAAIYNAVAPSAALMGHSMGGGAAFLAADSLSVNNNSWFKTIIGLAPAESTTNGVSSINSASQVQRPTLIFSGAQDGVTPATTHHLPIYNNIPSCKTYVSITGGAHCYFANPNFNCDFGESVSSSGISISRAEQQATTNAFLLPWLHYYLKDSCAALSTFQDSVLQATTVNTQQSCPAQATVQVIDSVGVLWSSLQGNTYQWYLNDSIIVGANGISHIPTSSGIYRVEVYLQGPCPLLSDAYLHSINGTNEAGLDFSFEYYPQPVQDFLMLDIEYPKEDNILLFVYNIQGQMVFSVCLKSNEKSTIDLTHLKKGVYLGSLSSGSGYIHQYFKLIKS